jgi:3-hydroxyisobutyrate dehydrogenase-like beta-hydroxyacid dehydrogenase
MDQRSQSVNLRQISVLGYGEVGKIFAAGLLPAVDGVSAWDLKFANPQTRDTERAHAALAGVRAAESMADAGRTADLLICAVTASHTLRARLPPCCGRALSTST